jgi:hypothetical protein
MKHIGKDVISKFKYNEVNGGVIRVKWDGRNKSAPQPNNKGYIMLGVTMDSFQIMYSEHRITYLLHNPDMDQSLTIDHINGIKTDNRIDNLRAVSTQHNLFNTHDAKGYSWSKAAKKFCAHIGFNETKIHLGTYDTILDARAAYLRGKKKYHVIQ